MIFLKHLRSESYSSNVSICDEFLLRLELHYFFFQELVTKVFQQMWFTPLKGEENSDVLVKRVVHMTDVVSL